MSPQRRSPPAAFQPRFTLGLLYFALFFLVFALLFVLPELMEVASAVPPGPQQQEIARETARQAIRPHLPVVVVLALLATGLGIYTGWLPGFRRRG